MADVTPVTSMLAEYVGGDSYRTLGRRYGMQHEQARRIVLEQGASLIRDLDAI